MTDKELRKLNRKQLLELLLLQAKENSALKAQIQSLEEQLQSRQILLEKAGNIAEAALQLNQVFQKAQAAADQYVDNVRRLTECAPADPPSQSNLDEQEPCQTSKNETVTEEQPLSKSDRSSRKNSKSSRNSSRK